MKLLLFTLTALLSFGTLKSDAQDIQVSTAVTNAFHHAFKNADDVEVMAVPFIIAEDEA